MAKPTLWSSIRNSVKAWFANIETKIHDSTVFGDVYKNQLVIVCSSIEKIQKEQEERGRKPEEIPVLKAMIKNRMMGSGHDREFNDLLARYGLMKPKKKGGK